MFASTDDGGGLRLSHCTVPTCRKPPSVNSESMVLMCLPFYHTDWLVIYTFKLDMFFLTPYIAFIVLSTFSFQCQW